MTRTVLALTASASAALLAGGCSTAPKSEAAKSEMSGDVSATLAKFKEADSSLQSELTSAVGYAVLPDVSKGAAVVGASYGKGEVFEGGGKIGYCSLSQGTIGAQIGGQRYSELLIFTTHEAFEDFKDGEYDLAATASAVAGEADRSRARDSQKGVLVYVTDARGLMAEAAVGAQKFRFTPVGMASGSSKSSSSSY